MKATARRLGWFILVGLGATAIHFFSVVGLVRLAGMQPVHANVVGWLLAFMFSFLGHYHKTFRDSNAPMGRAALRFFAISAMGFACNQAAYVLLLRFSGLRYDAALALVLAAIAVMTYLLGRRWAFAR